MSTPEALAKARVFAELWSVNRHKRADKDRDVTLIEELAALLDSTSAAARAAAIEECADEVPTNWCDPLLTGVDGIKIPAGCPEIERLLNGLRKNIRSLVSDSRLPPLKG